MTAHPFRPEKDSFGAALGALRSRQMRAWALVEAGDPEAIDVFLSRDEAENALADCVRDEPEWREFLRIEEIELAGGLSPN